MSDSPLSDLLQLAIQDIKQGNLKAGKAGLARVINTAPDSVYAEKAWIWMSATFNDPEQKRLCLENALKINPNNETAQKGLSRLPKPITQEATDEAEEFEDPAWLTDDDEDREIISPPRLPKKTQRTDSPPHLTPQPLQKSDQQLIDEYVSIQTARGWQIINRTETSVQLRKPKQWSNLLLVLGTILLCFYGTGLIVLLLALVDYLLQKEQVVFVTADELRIGAVTIKNRGSSLSPLTIIVVLGLGAFFLLLLFVVALILTQ